MWYSFTRKYHAVSLGYADFTELTVVFFSPRENLPQNIPQKNVVAYGSWGTAWDCQFTKS